MCAWHLQNIAPRKRNEMFCFRTPSWEDCHTIVTFSFPENWKDAGKGEEEGRNQYVDSVCVCVENWNGQFIYLQQGNEHIKLLNKALKSSLQHTIEFPTAGKEQCWRMQILKNVCSWILDTFICMHRNRGFIRLKYLFILLLKYSLDTVKSIKSKWKDMLRRSE